MEKESYGAVRESEGVDKLYWEINVTVVAHHQDVNKISQCFIKQNIDKIRSNITASFSSCARNVQC